MESFPMSIASAVKWFQFHLRANASMVALVLAMSIAPVEQAQPESQGALLLNPPQLFFGNHEIETTTDAKAVTLENRGKEAITIVDVLIKGDFTHSHLCPETLQPGKSCVISIKFRPAETDKRDGKLLVKYKTSDSDSDISSEPVDLRGTGIRTHLHVLPSSLGPVLIVVLIYFMGLVLVRWNMVARPTRTHLQAHLEGAKNRVEILIDEAGGKAQPGIARIKELLTKSDELIADQGFLSKVFDWFFWTRGQELCGWEYLHKAEVHLAFFLPEERLRAALECAETELRQTATPPALGLADRIHGSLTAVPVLSQDRAQQVLRNALNYFRNQDTTLSPEVNQAADTPPKAQLAEKVVAFIIPQATSLAEQVEQVIGAADDRAIQPRQLLQEAANLLKSQAVTLAEKLKKTSGDAEWKALLPELRDYLKKSAALSEKIKQALPADPMISLPRWRALLAEALDFLYDLSDTSFSTMISWHNKTMWLIACGLLLIVTLSAVMQDHRLLLLVGATGGLLSRLQRSLYRQDVPTDYGASWTSLFLSPVVGALAGWSGVLLLVLCGELKILGDALKVSPSDQHGPVALGFALLLGISERYFSGIQTSLEEKLRSLPGAAQPSDTAILKIVASPTMPAATVGKEYKLSLTATGGKPPYTWAILPNGKPPDELKWLNLDSSGQIVGTPTARTSGPVKFTLQVKDAASSTKSQEFTIEVN